MHTPGPWTIQPGGGHAYPSIVGSESIHTNGEPRNSLGISSASYSDTVCELHSDLRLPGPAANARLIAAAPELLEALKAIVKANDEGPASEWVARMIACDKIARAAIARAEFQEKMQGN